jgi:hypothetical protein
MKKIILATLVTAFFAFTNTTVHAQTTASKYTDDDYMKYKKETDEKIMANEKRIAELRTKKAQTASDMKDRRLQNQRPFELGIF